jgi:two-component system nitrogen regulation response regulator GlnG
MRFSWPGNVRQLENVIERGIVMCDERVIQTQHLPELSGPVMVSRTAARAGPDSLEDAVDWFLEGRLGTSPPAAGALWDATLRRVGSVLIRRALKTAGGVQLQAAELLGIHRNTLRKKLSETGAAQDGSS